MRAAILTKPGGMDLLHVETSLADDRVAVAVTATGICGTDVHAFTGHHSFLTYPRILGHEIAGVVTAVGPDVRGVDVGARVVVNPFVSCGVCRTCRRGFPNLCPRLQVTGIHVDGGFADAVHVAPSQLYTVPRDLDLSCAALVEPLSIGAEAVACGAVGPGDRVLIIGAGPIGLACLLFALSRGGETIITDQIPARLDRAKALGASVTINAATDDADAVIAGVTEGMGADVVIEAVGARATIEAAVGWVAPGGCLVLLGLYDGAVAVQPAEWIRRGLRLVASRLNRGRFPEAIEYLRSHPYSASLITHRIGLDALPDTMRRLARRELDACKVIVEPRR